MLTRKLTHHSLLLVTSLAIAGNATAHDDGLFTGFYAGINGGGLQTAAKMDTATAVSFTNPGPATDFLTTAQSARLWKNTGIGALTLGYGNFIGEKFHLAGEIFANFGHRNAGLQDAVFNQETANSQNVATSVRSKLKNWEYGVDLKPGFLYNPCSLVYGRVGVAFNEHTLNATSGLRYAETVTPSSADTFLAFDENKKRAALRLGIGMEHAMTEHLSFTADYIYTHYGRVNAAGTTNALGATTVSNGLINTVSSRVATQAGMLGLKYYF